MSLKPDDTATTHATSDGTTTPTIGAVKNPYVRPVLTKYGKVSRLTAAVTGSLVELFGVNLNG